MSDIQAGSVVVLNSGDSPVLTVQEITHGGKQASVIWFVNGQINQHYIPLAALRLVEN